MSTFQPTENEFFAANSAIRCGSRTGLPYGPSADSEIRNATERLRLRQQMHHQLVYIACRAAAVEGTLETWLSDWDM